MHPLHVICTNLIKNLVQSIDLTIYAIRRVHISEATAKALNGQFELEPGDGEERDDYIRNSEIKTFLVAVPEVSIICI